MDQLKYIIGLVFAALLVFSTVVVTQKCTHCPDCPPVVSSSDTTYLPGDSIPYPVPFIKPVPYKVIVYVDSSSTTTDTAAIIADYLSTRIYADSSYAQEVNVWYNIAVQNNQLQMINFRLQNNRQTAIIHTTHITKPLPKLYSGLAIGVNDTTSYFGIRAIYVGNNAAFSAGITRQPGNDFIYEAGIYLPIKISKK